MAGMQGMHGIKRKKQSQTPAVGGTELTQSKTD
jgi:hypothetical protein